MAGRLPDRERRPQPLERPLGLGAFGLTQHPAGSGRLVWTLHLAEHGQALAKQAFVLVGDARGSKQDPPCVPVIADPRLGVANQPVDSVRTPRIMTSAFAAA